MSWPALFSVFLVSHLAGDYLVQTDWQARNKTGGLGRAPLARRALLSHVGTYTICLVPALIWIANDRGVGTALATVVLIALPHLLIDDGRALSAYIKHVKGCGPPVDPGLTSVVDQSVHVISLWAVALVVAA